MTDNTPIPEHCGRSVCWKEDGHDGPCAPSGRPHPDDEIQELLAALHAAQETERASWERAIKAESQVCLDKDAHWRLDEAVERAVKAEQNADTHRHTATGWMNTAQDWQDVAEEWEARSIRLARALDLPDTATTDQMVARIEEINAGTHAPDPEKVADQLLVSFSPTEVLIEHPLIGRHTRALDIPVSDEMVERAMECMREKGYGYLASHAVKNVITAALTPEPPRPEGAEFWESVIADQVAGDLAPGAIRALADTIAERGLRVVGEEQS